MSSEIEELHELLLEAEESIQELQEENERLYLYVIY